MDPGAEVPSPAGATKRRSAPIGAVSVALGALAALLVGWLSVRMLFEGHSKLSDDILYARSLWGLAHGQGYNPVRELHALLIHANLVLYLLAPFALLAPAAKVLAWGQALALGSTVAQVGWTFGRAWQQARPARADLAPWVALGAGGLALASPAVHNPFLCGLHPDVLGLPFMTACVFRVVERRGLDLRALLWMAPALLVREDYFLYLASLAIFAPHDGEAVFSKRARAALGVGGVSVFAAYYAVPYLMGGGEGYWSNVVDHHVKPKEGDEFLPYALGKSMLLASFLACMGGMWWRQWRWVLVGFPALMLNLLMQNLPEQQVELQYVALLAWALLGASYSAWRAWLSDGAPKGAALRWGAVGVAAFLLLSALPGGRLFAWENFGWSPRAWGTDRCKVGLDEQASLRATLAALDPREGLVVSAFVGARLADRAWISDERYFTGPYQAPDPQLKTVMLARSEWMRVGRGLSGQHGFTTLGLEGDYLLMSRSAATIQRVRGDRELHEALNAARCTAPLLRWPEVGLSLCKAQQDDEGNHIFLFYAEGDPTASGSTAGPLEVLVVRAGEARPTRLDSLHGVSDLSKLPPKSLTVLYEARRVEAPQDAFLITHAGRALTPQAQDGPLPTPAVPLR